MLARSPTRPVCNHVIHVQLAVLNHRPVKRPVTCVLQAHFQAALVLKPVKLVLSVLPSMCPVLMLVLPALLVPIKINQVVILASLVLQVKLLH